MVEIICSGFGGQGVLVAGMILADAGMEEGKHVTWYPSYGSEMRGGTANCNIKMDDKEIPSPYCHDIDILYTLNDAAIDKFESQIKPGGILLVNSSLVRPERKFRHDVTVIKFPLVILPMNWTIRREPISLCWVLCPMHHTILM